MNGEQRRQKIVQMLKTGNKPLSGSALAESFSVSRQVIVQDIALLRANGMDILSTNRGYLLQNEAGVSRVFKVRHEDDEVEQEMNLIHQKMAQLGTRNFGAYARKMLLDGYIIKVDYTEQKKLAAAVSHAAANINQVCRRINQTGRFYAADIAELKVRQEEIWSLLKESQKQEL